MLALWLRAEDGTRLEEREGDSSHDRRHSAGGAGVCGYGNTTCLHPKAEGSEKDTELPWELSISL